MEDSFDLSEVSNVINNDADGRLLAQYLKQKSGKVVTRKIYERNENKRLSVDVRLHKPINDNNTEKAETNQKDNYVEDSEGPAKVPVAEQAVVDENTPVRGNFAKSSIISARSPLASYLKRTPSASHKLRLTAMKQAAHRNRQRSLQTEFNNVAEMSSILRFSPPISSTPLHSGTPERVPLENGERTPPKTTKENDREQFSPRTFSIEKSKTSGQIVLTPLPSPSSSRKEGVGRKSNVTFTTTRHMEGGPPLEPQHNSNNCTHVQLQFGSNSQREILITPTKSGNNSGMVVRVMENSISKPNTRLNCTDNEVIASSPHRSSTHQMTPEIAPVVQQKDSLPSPKSPTNNNMMVRANLENEDKTLVANVESDSLPKGNNFAEPKSVAASTNNLRTTSIKKGTKNMSDIMTDDDEPESTLIATRNNESSSNNNISRSLRVRKLKKKKPAPNVKSSTNELSLKTTSGINTRRRKPLNKAPRTPINGEKFADELKKHLAGLSNREVLDLRKRKTRSLSKNNYESPLRDNPPPERFLICRNDNFSTDDSNDSPNYPPVSSEPRQTHEEHRNMNGNEEDKTDLQTNCLAVASSNENQFQQDVFEDELSSDRVSFISKEKNAVPKLKKHRRSKRSKSNTELLESYLSATQRMTKSSRKLNESKRSLYSENLKESEKETSTLGNVDILLPPPMFRSSSPGRNVLPTIAVSPVRDTTSNTEVPSSPKSDVPVQENDHVFKKPEGVPPKRKKPNPKTKKFTKEEHSTVAQESNGTTLRRSQRDRKPVEVPLFWKMLEKNLIKSMEMSEKRKRNQTLKRKMENSANKTDEERLPLASSTANSVERPRKLRSRKQSNLLDIPEEDFSNQTRDTNMQNSGNKTHQETIPLASSTANLERKRTKSKFQKPNKLLDIPEDDVPIFATRSTSSNVKDNKTDHLSDNESPQLTTLATTDIEGTEVSTISKSTQKTKQVRVKVQRLRNDRATQCLPYEQEVSSSMSPSNTMVVEQETPKSQNLLTWLKDLPTNRSVDETCSLKSFTNMNLSSHTNLIFKNVSNVDYAFYETGEENSIGYMRFQPGQIKKSSRVLEKLKLVIISGEFKVITDGEVAYTQNGDLLTINNGARYSIENVGSDTSVILFIKM